MTSFDAIEVNFDGLVGPSHNYGGLSHGNLASAANKGNLSSPKQAAIEGLEKAWRLAQSGYVQGILPPQERPFIPLLRQIGFSGSDSQALRDAWNYSPQLIRNVSAASSMWAANAATISPSADCADNRLHATIANLVSMPHRAIEAQTTYKILQALFADKRHFEIHKPLPAHAVFGDEGAANHMRMGAKHGNQGIEIFVYGREGFEVFDAKYPARQTLETGQAIMRNHLLDSEQTIHLRQSKKAIEAGAFHNDVVAIANRNVLFYHEFAFEDNLQMQESISRAARDFEPIFIEVSNQEVPISDAIESYLFNTQLLDSQDSEGPMSLIAPLECFENERVKHYLDKLVSGNGPIAKVEYVDVRQSMNNGGGPACLRLRVVLTEGQIGALGGRFILDESLYQDLRQWIEKHYREELDPMDLGDVSLLNECRSALDELSSIMRFGNIYDFQN